MLRHRGGDHCVTDELEEKNENLNQQNLAGDISVDNDKKIDDTAGEQNAKRAIISKNDETQGTSGDEIIYEPVRKIDTYAISRRKIATLAHTLKRLSHEGRMDKFNDIVAAVKDRCVMKKLRIGKCVRNYMEIADIRFTALDAQIEARRLKYDTSLTDSEVFLQMEKMIKFTSHPTVSSMTYLARKFKCGLVLAEDAAHGNRPKTATFAKMVARMKEIVATDARYTARLGSALSMKTTLDNGLVYLQYAREHCERVLPCKDTGMVYYIEINLLSQKYEQNPTEVLKKEVLKTTERAIAQFSNEADDIRKDYERMLMLKMAYCFLGLSLFGKRIKNVSVSDGDRQSAKKCMDFIEIPDIWERMESRRKMLYHIAKAEYYRQESVNDLSILNAKEAEKFAQENKWTAELPNILDLIEDIEANSQSDVNDEQSANDIIQKLFEDETDEDD